MYITEKEMRDRLKLDTKSDLIGKLIMAYMTIRQLQEKLEGAKNTEQQVQADSALDEPIPIPVIKTMKFKL